MKLEVGKYYLNGQGKVYGPMVETFDGNWLMCQKSGRWFHHHSGRYVPEYEGGLDLTTECTPDGTPITAAKKRVKRRWYVVMEMPTRATARFTSYNLNFYNKANFRVVADLDLKGRGK